ncbi:MAG: methyl-accepting chemotaxis protein [Selenomonadaceae bacterium]|nr:methyl-accepting chemotaxis protein [Selenomonadaceae bacterium]
MGIRGRLLSLSVIAAVTILIIATMGYYQASVIVEESAEEKLLAKVGKESSGFETWLLQKQRIAIDTAHFMEDLDDNLKGDRKFLNVYRGDETVLNIAYADETGRFTSYVRKDFQNVDVHTRDWYINLMKEKQPTFTNPYESLSIGNVVISATAPIFKNGKFYGGICVNIGIGSLLAQVGAMNYEGSGEGFLFDGQGHLIATFAATAGKSISEISALAHHETEIMTGGSIGLSSIQDGNVVSYARVPSTGWILAFAVPEQVVYAPLSRIRTTYVVLTILGIIAIIAMFKFCMTFANDIVTSVRAVEKRAVEIAKGNLAFRDLPVKTNDEIGELTKSFNTMQRDLKKLVGTTKEAADGVLSSSKNLLQYVEMNAESTREIAGLASLVSKSMTRQMEDVMKTAGHVDAAFSDMDELAKNAELLEKNISGASTNASFVFEDVKTILANDENEKALAKCFESLFETFEGLARDAGELTAIVRTVEERTGYIIDNVNSMDIVSRETAKSAETIETAIEAQEAAVLDIVASAEAMDNLAKSLEENAKRFKL